MAGGDVVVVGAGVTGMAAALMLARRGQRVTLFERDRLDVGRPEDAASRTRPGIPHYLQPHAFIPRGRAELREHLPDVYADLLDAGAREVDLRRKLPGPTRGEDEALQYLAVRRPLIEWALRRAVAREADIDARAGTRVREVAVEGGRAVGVRTDAGTVAARLVVDAHGRRESRGGAATGALSSPCGVVYYSRYYRCRPGFTLPDGPWFLSPRGDLGYAAFASFPGDNATFAAVLAVPPARPEWRRLAEADAFESAVAAIPMLRSWVDPAGVEPITAVLPMAGLHNRLLDDPARLPGWVCAGDAYCHLDPTLAFGLALGLAHAAAVAQAVAAHDDAIDIAAAYRAATQREAQERYGLSAALDEQRLRMWLGEPVDVRHHDGDYALFSLAAAGAVARVDPEVFRIFNRRIGGLDSTAVLDDNRPLREQIERRFAEMTPTGLGPAREEMLALVAG